MNRVRRPESGQFGFTCDRITSLSVDLPKMLDINPVQPSRTSERTIKMAQKLAFRHLRAIQYRILRRSQFRRTFLFALKAGSPLVRSLLASLTLLAVAMAAPVAAAQKVALFIDVSKPGPKIDRNLFGQFAEHLGHGVYEGIWVGRTPKFRTRAGFAMMSSLRSKR